MSYLEEKVQQWFDLSEDRANEVVEGLFVDYKAIQDRLTSYTEVNAPFSKVVDELDGFNVDVDETSFEIEYNDLQLIIEYVNGTYRIGVPVDIYIPNDKYIEPLELNLEVIGSAC